jgi:hypothetical protein
MKMRKAQLRECARHVLQQRNVRIEVKSGPGIMPGARLLAWESDGADEREIAVRTSLDREVGLTRHPDGRWATIPNMDEVIVVVPSADDSGSAEVLSFKPTVLMAVFDTALKHLKKRSPNLSHKAPIFVRLDKPRAKGKANVTLGVDHDVTWGLKDKAEWHTIVPLASVPGSPPAESTEGFIERVKREFAALNGVDVSKVVVEFRITA